MSKALSGRQEEGTELEQSSYFGLCIAPCWQGSSTHFTDETKVQRGLLSTAWEPGFILRLAASRARGWGAQQISENCHAPQF